MSEFKNQTNAPNNFNVLDALLYTLAASSMTIISISFLLWLRF